MTGLDQWVGPLFDVQVHMYQREIVELSQKKVVKEGLLPLPNKVMKNIMIVIPIGPIQAIIRILMIKMEWGLKRFLSLLLWHLWKGASKIVISQCSIFASLFPHF